MNKLIQNKASVFALMAALAMPMFAMAEGGWNQVPYDANTNQFSIDSGTSTTPNATGTPSIELVGASQLTNTNATITVSFDSENAQWALGYAPALYVEYENDTTGETQITNVFYAYPGTHMKTWSLYYLTRGTKYNYRAVMKYGGHTYRTNWKSFKTTGAVVTTNTSTTNNSSSNNSNNNTVTIPTVTNTASTIGVTRVTSSVKSAIYTAGSNHANGVAIGITDTQARVSQGDVIEFMVQYQNTRTTSLMNTELAIVLPEEYEYISSRHDFEYDESTNTITLPTGRIAAGGLVKSVTFKVRAIGDGTRDVKTTATLYYEGGKISASDRDAFHGGSKSVLGASVFGAGFFPQTFVGWLLIIILVTVIIIAARRYMKPTPVVEIPKTA